MCVFNWFFTIPVKQDVYRTYLFVKPFYFNPFGTKRLQKAHKVGGEAMPNETLVPKKMREDYVASSIQLYFFSTCA